MSDKPKIIEKSVRFADPMIIKREVAVRNYISEIEGLNNESQRSHRFSMFVQEIIDINPGFIDNYCEGIEKFVKIKNKDRIQKGEIDNLFGNVIIEFERSIPKNLHEAEEQLKTYTSILWSSVQHEKRPPYICIATDGLRFICYSPKNISDDINEEGVNPEDIQLSLIEDVDWKKILPNDVYFWLDRYFVRKEILSPTSKSFVKDFGLHSHAFQTISEDLLRLWKEIKLDSSFAVLFESWAKYLKIVYGSEVAGDELFINHSFLATLAKIMAWIRISDIKTIPQDDTISELLSGELFKKSGIDNFIEEDFFAWLARPQTNTTGISASRRLFTILLNYNLRELSEDVLKSLYQELVDPSTRHDLGEFYTPDWLAHRIVNKFSDENQNGSFFDPACGSGTFIYLTIHEKRRRMGDSSATFKHILENVYGADIHPLAVMVSKTNYLLAMGDLVKHRKGTYTIPVFLSDTLKLPERWMGDETSDFFIHINGRGFYVPDILLKDSNLFDKAVDIAKEFALRNKDKAVGKEDFIEFLKSKNSIELFEEEFIKPIYNIADVLKYFIEGNRDTIWAFILKNIYKPLFFKNKFDFIVGNPPWISYRFFDKEYQSFLKKQITDSYNLLSSHGELITHIEIAVLFLLRSADLYLKKDGKIAFVMPKSVFYADQHENLRKKAYKLKESSNQSLDFFEIWDCENVKPLFNVPSSVLFAVTNDEKLIKESIIGEIITGKLSDKNTSLIKAEKDLTFIQTDFYLSSKGSRSFWAEEKSYSPMDRSYYDKKFYQGATIVPRSFWFVQVNKSPLGINPMNPLLETDERAIKESKEPYRDVRMRGNIDPRFLFATVLSSDLLPFGHLEPRMVVLPLIKENNRYEIIDSIKAEKKYLYDLFDWLVILEKKWLEKRGLKAEKESLYNWLNYRNKLTNQNPNSKYLVIYNTSGSYLASSIVENKPVDFHVNDQVVTVEKVIVDTKTYYYEPKNFEEAYYLTAFLNAPVIDEMIKPMQSRGLWGPRDIHKKVFEIPIPKFNEESKLHLRLVELGKDCRLRVNEWVSQNQDIEKNNIGRLRTLIRKMLKTEFDEIDIVVEKILKTK